MIELTNPAYDPEAETLTYDATVLADYGEPGLAHLAQQQQDYAFPETFAAGSLFIDGVFDCNDGSATCVHYGDDRYVGAIDNVGFCASGVHCNPCSDSPKSEYYGKLCADAHPDQCSYGDEGGAITWSCYVTDVSAD